MELVLVMAHCRLLSPTDRTTVESQNDIGWKELQSLSVQPTHRAGPTFATQDSAQHEPDFLCCVLFLQQAVKVIAKQLFSFFI